MDFLKTAVALTNFQELVAGQIFEDLVQEFKVPQSLQNQFEENWDISIALDLGQRNWSSWVLLFLN